MAAVHSGATKPWAYAPGYSSPIDKRALRLFPTSRTGELLLDPDLKLWWDGAASVADACLGYTASAAFNVFAKAVVREKRIPFELRSESRDELEARMRGQRVAEGVRRGYEEIASGRYVTREDYERDCTRQREAV